jgi:hypothetical protein
LMLLVEYSQQYRSLILSGVCWNHEVHPKIVPFGLPALSSACIVQGTFRSFSSFRRFPLVIVAFVNKISVIDVLPFST